MWLITDVPESLAGWADHPGWRSVLPGSLRPVWGALECGRPAAAAVVAPPVPLQLDGLLVVDESEASQFDALLDLLKRGHPGFTPPVAALALCGRGFHGNRNRPWRALRGNLHMCYACTPRLAAASVGAALTMLPAVAVLDALAQVAPDLRAGIKWMNDIEVADRKLAGVITATQVRGAMVEHVLFGIGVNVEVAPVLPSQPFVRDPDHVTRHAAVTLPQLLWPLLAALERRMDELRAIGPEALAKAYRQASTCIGRCVEIWPEDALAGLPEEPRQPLAEGVLLDIEPDLGLRLRGVAQPIQRGRLVLRR